MSKINRLGFGPLAWEARTTGPTLSFKVKLRALVHSHKRKALFRSLVQSLRDCPYSFSALVQPVSQPMNHSLS